MLNSTVMHLPHLILLPVVLLALVGQAIAAPDFKLSELKMGKIVAGDEIDLDALDGRVVAIEYWGPR